MYHATNARFLLKQEVFLTINEKRFSTPIKESASELGRLHTRAESKGSRSEVNSELSEEQVESGASETERESARAAGQKQSSSKIPGGDRFFTIRGEGAAREVRGGRAARSDPRQEKRGQKVSGRPIIQA